MRTLAARSTLLMILAAAPLAAQPIGGHQVAVKLRSTAGTLNGELLAVTPDSVWVMARDGQTMNAAVTDIGRILVQRYKHRPAVALSVGSAVGLVSGLALTAACSSVEDVSCGGVLLISLLSGVLVGGLAAHSIQSGRYREIPPGAMAPYARFPQGPPPGVDLNTLGVPPVGGPSGPP